MEHGLDDAAYKEREKSFNDAIERKRVLSELNADTNFQWFIGVLKTQLEARFSRLVGFPDNLDKIVQNNYTCGEIAGIKLALELVDKLIENAQSVIDMEKAMQDREKDYEERGE